jgi:hypothetical protein
MKASKKQITVSALLAGLGFLALIPAVYLGRIPQLMSLFMSFPFWSAALLFFLAAAGIHIRSCRRTAFLGLMGCIVIGGIAFIAGYIGPIIFTPSANQGPLLGIFITGPLGSLVGTLVGVLAGIGKNIFANKEVEATGETPSPHL